MEIFLKIIKKLSIISINFLIFILSFLIKKDDNIWLFGSWFGKSFSDNSKYLYLYCHNNKEKLGLKDVVWITNDANVYRELKEGNYSVFKKWTVTGIYFHLRAGYHFICQDTSDINSYFSIRAKRIQLWHGVGFKKMTYVNQVPEIKALKYKLIYLFKLYTSPGMWYKYIFFSTSDFASINIFKFSFRLYENNVVVGNYPRNIYLKESTNNDDIYLDKNQKEMIELIRVIKSEGNKILLYLPTYRNIPQIHDKNVRLPLDLENTNELIKFNDFLKGNNLYFFTKFHFAGDTSIVDNSNNFINLSSDFDIYPILKYTDVLITDYSSVYADFLFLNKPIIFYPYDLEEYKNLDKGFLFDYKSVTPGNIARNIEDLRSQIIYALDNDDYKDKRQEILKMYFGENSKDSFDVIIDKIRSSD